MKKETNTKKTSENANQPNGIHSSDLSPSRGTIFQGFVTKKFPRRVVIEFERTVFIPKYERFSRKTSRLHARLPAELESKINVGDYIKIQQCRPLSKIIHFIVVEKIRDADVISKKALERAQTEKEIRESKAKSSKEAKK
jgi:small subunit ribosomal protein S17